MLQSPELRLLIPVHSPFADKTVFFLQAGKMNLWKLKWHETEDYAALLAGVI